MRTQVLERLRCSNCSSESLQWKSFDKAEAQEIRNGVLWCNACPSWFPIEDDILDFLPSRLAYSQDRAQFWKSYLNELQSLSLKEFRKPEDNQSVEAQKKQQVHFDWFAQNNTQTYTAYEQMPFWKAVDELTFKDWQTKVPSDAWLLDVGCAQGRACSHFFDLPINIVGFDISKPLIRQASEAYKASHSRSKADFLVADGTTFPFKSESFDRVLVYGVLHHLPDPSITCKEIARVLNPGGIYFGSENNETVFRGIFDLAQKLIPLWHEEAGKEPLIDEKELRSWFSSTDLGIQCRTHVYVPPHLINILRFEFGRRFLKMTDRIGSSLPYLRHNGGLIVIQGERIQHAK